MRWQGAPDTDELLFDQAEASHIPTPPDFEAKDLSLVFVDDCLDMRVGNRASKRRRTVSGYKTEASNNSTVLRVGVHVSLSRSFPDSQQTQQRECDGKP